MNKLTTKQWAKCSLNKKVKSIRISTEIFKTKSEGELTLRTNQAHLHILNQKGIDKLINEGWSVVDGITKSTNNITESVQTVDLTGDPTTEESIRKYYVMKKQRQGVHFVKGLYSINEKSKVSAADMFGASVFPKQEPIKINGAIERWHNTELGRERKAQLMEVGV